MVLHRAVCLPFGACRMGWFAVRGGRRTFINGDPEVLLPDGVMIILACEKRELIETILREYSWRIP